MRQGIKSLVKQADNRFKRNESNTGLTQRVAAGQLWPLRVLPSKLVADAVQQLDIALLWVLPECGDEGPRHGACCLGGDSRVGSVITQSVSIRHGKQAGL